jgi:hypothetical protein
VEGLDFTNLTDDQLIALIRGACSDAVRRGAAVAAAAQEAYLSAAARGRIAREAAEREAERLKQEEAERVAREAAETVRRRAEQQKTADAAAAEVKAWAKRKGVAQALVAAGYDVVGDQLVVWIRPGGVEKRVFLQKKGYGETTYATLYVTGNQKHSPDSLVTVGLGAALRAKVAPVLRAIARDWHQLKVDLDEAVAWTGEAIPLKVDLPAPSPEASAPEATP